MGYVVWFVRLLLWMFCDERIDTEHVEQQVVEARSAIIKEQRYGT